MGFQNRFALFSVHGFWTNHFIFISLLLPNVKIRLFGQTTGGDFDNHLAQCLPYSGQQMLISPMM